MLVQLTDSDALQVLVYTQDASGLFLRICRYFDSQAVSIQDARIYTTRHGWALDSFIVMLPAYDHALRRDPLLIETELCQALQQDLLPSEPPHDHYRDIRFVGFKQIYGLFCSEFFRLKNL